MDVHSRYRTEAHKLVKPRFNERFILSLSNCQTCLAIDDELNILPLTQSIMDIKEIQLPGMKKASSDANFTENLYLTEEQKQLKDLKVSLKETKPIGNLVALCKTYDQASSVMQMEYRDCVINLLDTPGHQDFSEDTYRVLTAVDSALMVIDAANGVETQTLRLIEVCRSRGTPIMTFINKMEIGRAHV